MTQNNSNSNGNSKNGKHPGGAPSRYKAEYCEQARKLAEHGLTDAEMAGFFGINQVTLYRWQAAHPEFSKSLKLGKDVSDARVERSLYHRANGYSHEAVKIFCDPKSGKEKVVKYVQHYPPDTTACIFWLKNRRQAEWRDRVESVTVPMEDGARVERAIQSFLDDCAKRGDEVSREDAVRYLSPEMPEMAKELGKIG